MPDPAPGAVTLQTLHQAVTTGFAQVTGELAGVKSELTGVNAQLGGVKSEVAGVKRELGEFRAETREGFRDLKVTMITGFRSLPSRESADEMVRLLRESNRLQAERFTALEHQNREQHQETMTLLRTLVDGQRQLYEGQRDIRDTLVLLVRSLFGGRGNGAPGDR